MVIFLVSVGAIGICIFILPYFLISAKPFPKPSGKWQVGTSDLIWDKPDLSGIVAKVWYPTDIENNNPDPYIDRIDLILSALTVGKNPLYKFIFKLYFARIRTPVSRDAILGDIPDGFPVILLSPGFGLTSVLNTFYALEFASHGSIVIGINHPGSSASTLLSNGSAIGIDEKTNEMTKKLFSNNSKLLKENPTEFARLTDETACEAMMLQADNISFVLDTVLYLNSATDSLLYQKVKETKIFAAGHSIGGSASFIACGQDWRISKGVNIDSYINIDPNLISESTNYQNKELLFVRSDRKQYPKNKTRKGVYDLLYAVDEVRIENFSTKANLRKISFAFSSHLDFTDLPFLITIPSFGRAVELMGDRDGRKLLIETAAIAIEFFNQET